MKSHSFLLKLLLCLIIAAQLSAAPIALYARGPTDDTDTQPTVEDTDRQSSTTFKLQNPLKVDSVGGLVQNFIEIFTYVVILFAVLLLVWVGLQFILARGNSTRISELKNHLLGIIVGVAVVIGARIIVQVVINTLQSTGTVDQGTIQSVQKAVNGN